jgi:nucleotide-binding universal stress UspA family protein
MNVLVGVDGTEKSLAAVRFVARLTSSRQDRITVFFAPPRRRRSIYPSVSAEAQLAMITAFTDSVLTQALAQLPEGFARASLVAEQEEPPARALLEAARRTESDLIVVGAGDSSHRLRFFVGGVAHRVIHEADRPVLAYRQKEGPETTGPLHVLLAVDPTETTDQVLTTLHQFTWPVGSRGRILHVTDYIEDERLRHWVDQSADFAATGWQAALDREVSEEHARLREQLATLQQRLPEIFHGEPPLVTVGHVVERIVEVVERDDTDLVILVGHRRGRISRWLGSSTEGVLLQAKASVLVLHGPS